MESNLFTFTTRAPILGMRLKGFPTTHWSVVFQAADGDTDESLDALSALCQTYWYPIYALSRSLGDSHEDAQDLAQGFFMHVVKSRLAARVDPRFGRFRSFLQVSFRNFRSAQSRRTQAVKRGGEFAFRPLADSDVAERYAHEPSAALTPEQRFDRNWALSVIDRAHALLAADYARADQEALFAGLSAFLPGHDNPASYEQLSAESGKTVTALRMEVSRLRKHYMELLRSVVAETVADPDDVTDELRYLFQTLIAPDGRS
jgi:RNA polymerase sigma-70 factor (ECF subfamily)